MNDKSEFYISTDGQLYYGETFYSILFPIVGLASLSYVGETLVVDFPFGDFKSEKNVFDYNLN